MTQGVSPKLQTAEGDVFEHPAKVWVSLVQVFAPNDFKSDRSFNR